jgi:PleD family two-component response regulator
LRLLQALADATAVAMENVQLYQELEARVQACTAELTAANEEIRNLSLTDELTGLRNRRGFFLFAEQVAPWRCAPENKPPSCSWMWMV